MAVCAIGRLIARGCRPLRARGRELAGACRRLRGALGKFAPLRAAELGRYLVEPDGVRMYVGTLGSSLALGATAGIEIWPQDFSELITLGGRLLRTLCEPDGVRVNSWELTAPWEQTAKGPLSQALQIGGGRLRKDI